MKTLIRYHATIGVLTLITLSNPLAPASAAGNEHPVCTPTRNVSTVQGINPVAGADAHCLVERKVTASPGSIQVSQVLGRGSPTQNAQPGRTLPVSAVAADTHAVERVLGRAGQPMLGAASRTPDSLAGGSRH